MILKSFDFQCDFDFQITTSKMILILNHLYLGDLILTLKTSTYDDFAHLCRYFTICVAFKKLSRTAQTLGQTVIFFPLQKSEFAYPFRYRYYKVFFLNKHY